MYWIFRLLIEIVLGGNRRGVGVSNSLAGVRPLAGGGAEACGGPDGACGGPGDGFGSARVGYCEGGPYVVDQSGFTTVGAKAGGKAGAKAGKRVFSGIFRDRVSYESPDSDFQGEFFYLVFFDILIWC